MTTSVVSPATTVTDLFELLDTGNLPEVAARFAADARYLRPGFGELQGRPAIAHFLNHQRPLVSSEHTLDAVVAEGAQVAVRGSFRGVLRDGNPAQGRFADFFEVVPDGLISRRETFFFAVP